MQDIQCGLAEPGLVQPMYPEPPVIRLNLCALLHPCCLAIRMAPDITDAALWLSAYFALIWADYRCVCYHLQCCVGTCVLPVACN